MNIEGLEIKTNNRGGVTYWKNNVLIGKKCCKCKKDKEVSDFGFQNIKKGILRAWCKECEVEYAREKRGSLSHINGKGVEARYTKKFITYWENGVMVGRRCTKCGENKKISEFNLRNKKKGTYRAECKDCENQRSKQYNEAHKETIKQQRKLHDEIHKEAISRYNKQYKEAHKETISKYNKQYKEAHREEIKQYNEKIKQNNIAEITNMLKRVNPKFKEFELPIYGTIYKVTNTKTKHIYIGQTTRSLILRYGSNIIKGWIEERKGKINQKFLDELIEEDLTIEIIGVGCCKYHLDKMEAYYIDKHNSYNNGYNNQAGNHNTTDGIEEFNQILSDHNLEFKDGKLKKRLHE